MILDLPIFKGKGECFAAATCSCLIFGPCFLGIHGIVSSEYATQIRTCFVWQMVCVMLCIRVWTCDMIA
jgi:hypothetical protein